MKRQRQLNDSNCYCLSTNSLSTTGFLRVKIAFYAGYSNFANSFCYGGVLLREHLCCISYYLTYFAQCSYYEQAIHLEIAQHNTSQMDQIIFSDNAFISRTGSVSPGSSCFTFWTRSGQWLI